MQLPDFITKAVEFFGFARQRLETLPDAVQAQAKITDLEGKLTQVTSDLTTAKQTIGTLEAKVTKLETDLKTSQEAVTAAQKEAEETKASVDKLASQKAAQITASQGQPPLTIKTTDKPAQTVTQPGLDPNLKGRARLIAHFSAQKPANKSE